MFICVALFDYYVIKTESRNVIAANQSCVWVGFCFARKQNTGCCVSVYLWRRFPTEENLLPLFFLPPCLSLALFSLYVHQLDFFLFLNRKTEIYERLCCTPPSLFFSLSLLLYYYICTAPAAKMAGLLRFSTMTTTTKTKKNTLWNLVIYIMNVYNFFTQNNNCGGEIEICRWHFVPCVCSRIILVQKAKKYMKRASKKIFYPCLLIWFSLGDAREILSY